MDRQDSLTAPPRGKSYHHGDLRNALLDSARKILEERSLADLSLRAVARRAGVLTRGSRAATGLIPPSCPAQERFQVRPGDGLE